MVATTFVRRESTPYNYESGRSNSSVSDLIVYVSGSFSTFVRGKGVRVYLGSSISVCIETGVTPTPLWERFNVNADFKVLFMLHFMVFIMVKLSLTFIVLSISFPDSK